MRRLFVAVFLVGCVRLASAQSLRDELRTHSDDPAGVEVATVDSSSVRDARLHLDLGQAAGSWKVDTRAAAARGWLAPIFSGFAAVPLAAHRNPARLAAPKPISRRFLSLPMLEWQRHAPPALTRSALIVIRPSLVIGRRMTWAPELGRAGRTIGFGVQVRVWLDGRPRASDAASSPGSAAGILATVRGMLDKR